MRRLLRLAYLLAQHPLHLHRALVRRGLALRWIDEFREFWDTVRPPSLPITDYASYTFLEYLFTFMAREEYPEGDNFDALDWQYARLLSYVKRRELHPLRMLKVAWTLRHCRRVLEFGAGAAPYAHFIDSAWPIKQTVCPADLPGLLQDYSVHRWDKAESRIHPRNVNSVLVEPWDGIVCTEVFEHLDDPIQAAASMRYAAPLVCFDYVESYPSDRDIVLKDFAACGTLTGPDRRGLYVWART